MEDGAHKAMVRLEGVKIDACAGILMQPLIENGGQCMCGYLARPPLGVQGLMHAHACSLVRGHHTCDQAMSE